MPPSSAETLAEQAGGAEARERERKAHGERWEAFPPDILLSTPSREPLQRRDY